MSRNPARRREVGARFAAALATMPPRPRFEAASRARRAPPIDIATRRAGDFERDDERDETSEAST